MSDDPKPAVWPPPADSNTEWTEIWVDTGTDKPGAIRLRQVRLWGKHVLIDESHRVFCDGCDRLLSPKSLLEPNNGHRPSPVAPALVAGTTWHEGG